MKIKIAMLKQADINNVKKLPVGPSLSECSLLCCQVMEARRSMRKRGHRKISLMINDLITIKYCNAVWPYSAILPNVIFSWSDFGGIEQKYQSLSR